jgi:hypothetical protein
METGDNLRRRHKQLIRMLVRNMVVKGCELEQPILVHIPDTEIPDTPLDEFEKGIEELLQGHHAP